MFENLQELFVEDAAAVDVGDEESKTFEDAAVVDAGDEKNVTTGHSPSSSASMDEIHAQHETFEDATIDEKQAVEETEVFKEVSEDKEVAEEFVAKNKKIREEDDAKICDFFKKMTEKSNVEESVVQNKTFEDTTVKVSPIKKTNPLLAFGQKFKNSNLF